jgi:hypothetical protein
MMISTSRDMIGLGGSFLRRILTCAIGSKLPRGNRQHGNSFIREIRNTFSKDGQEACSKSALTGPQSSRLSKGKKALTDDIQLKSIILRIITGKEA